MKRHLSFLLTSLPIIVFFVFTVVFYGPFSLYLPNSQEFWFGLSDVIRIVLPVSLAVFAVLCLCFFILGEKTGAFFRKLLFGVSLGMYLQGNYLNISYGSGVLDGTAVQWENYTKYGLGTTAVWMICLVFPFAVPRLLRIGKAKTDKMIAAASVFIVLMQIPAFVVQAFSFHPVSSTNLRITKEKEFELASGENIVIFILDTMDEEYYADFLKNTPEYTEKLNGFVHYGNTLASGARTPIAVPSMFTGIPFIRSETYAEYKDRVWSDENCLSRLNDAGYDVRVYSESVLFSDVCADYIHNFEKNKPKIGSWPVLQRQMYKMVLYRFMPHYLKRFFLIDTADFDAAMDTRDYVIKDYEMIRDYRKNGLTISEDAGKTVRIYHMRGAHRKYCLNRKGKLAVKAKRKETVAGCFGFVEEVLEDMKKTGIYDSSTVIITADHGDRHRAEQAIFLLKEAEDTRPYRDDDSPVSLFDLNVYLSGLAGIPARNSEYGMDLHELKPDMERERFFFRHKGGTTSSLINEYRFRGTMYDPDKLELVQVFQDGDDTADYVIGTELSFGMEQTGNQYIVDGFGNNTGIRTVLLGPHCKLEIPFASLPESGSLTVYVNVSFGSKLLGREMIVYANDREVLRQELNKTVKREGFRFEVPISFFGNDRRLALEFAFPWISEDEMDLPVLERTDSLRFVTMTIEER